LTEDLEIIFQRARYDQCCVVCNAKEDQPAEKFPNPFLYIKKTVFEINEIVEIDAGGEKDSDQTILEPIEVLAHVSG
jgi:hypothetical protein